MAKSQEDLLREELESLTPEELEQYEQQLMQTSDQERKFAPSPAELEQAKADVEPTTLESLSAGVVEGIPFLKDAVAAYDSMADSIEEDNVNFDTVYSNYKENLDEINTDLSNVEEQSPYTMAAGEIAGGAATMAAGGLALKGVGAGAKAAQYGAAIGTGAATELSRSRQRSASDLAYGATIGGVSELAGGVIAKGVKKGGRYLLDKADDVGSSAVKKILGVGNVSTKRQLFKHLKRTNQKESEFLNDILTQKLDDSSMVIDFNDAPELMLDKIQTKKRDIGEQIGKFYKAVDAENDIKIDLDDLKASLSEEVSTPFINSDDPGMQQIGIDLDSYIQNIGRKIKGVKRETTEQGVKMIEDVVYEDSWNLSRVHKLQKDIRKRIENIYKKNGLDLNASKEQQRQVASSLGKHMDDVIDNVNITDTDSPLDSIKSLRKQFGNMSSVEESLEAQMFRAKDDPIGIIKEALSFKSVVIGGAGASAFGPAGILLGPAASKIVNSPKTPLYLSKGIQNIANVVQAAPAGEIASRLNTAAIMSNDRFKDTLYGTIAEVNLKQAPIPRSTASIKERFTDIRNFLKLNQPTSVKDFDAVIESGDDSQIAAFIDNASKAPGSEKIIEPGVGIDGYVFTEEDKAQLELQLRQTDMPGAQRMEMMRELRLTGKVPNLEEVIQVPPKQHIPKTKKIQNY